MIVKHMMFRLMDGKMELGTKPKSGLVAQSKQALKRIRRRVVLKLIALIDRMIIGGIWLHMDGCEGIKGE